MSREEFIIKFNLQKLLGFDIEDDDTARIAQVFDCSPELAHKSIMKFNQNNLEQAESILMDSNDLHVLNKDSKKTIAFIGDSITSDRESYFNIIKTIFRNLKNINFIDAAVSGNRSSDALINLHERVIKHNPHIVSIMVGTNDIQRTNDSRGVCVTSIVEYERNLRHIIERLKQDKISIIINTLPPMDYIDFDYYYGQDCSKYDHPDLTQYNEIIRKLSCEYDLALNDMHNEFCKYPGKELLLEDGIHLSTMAQRLVAASLLPMLNRLLM